MWIWILGLSVQAFPITFKGVTHINQKARKLAFFYAFIMDQRYFYHLNSPCMTLETLISKGVSIKNFTNNPG